MEYILFVDVNNYTFIISLNNILYEFVFWQEQSWFSVLLNMIGESCILLILLICEYVLVDKYVHTYLLHIVRVTVLWP